LYAEIFEAVLIRANVKLAHSVIILPDTSSGLATKSDERTILATLSIKSINTKIKVFAHLMDRANLSHIRKARVDDVLISDAYTGYLLATHVLAPGIPQLVDQLIAEGSGVFFERMEIPSVYYGKQYGELVKYIQREHQALCVGLGREQEVMSISNVLSDDYSFLDQFIKKKFEQAGRGMMEKSHINVNVNPAPETIIEPQNFVLTINSGKAE
jgi:voltage-gated potassium channel